MGIGHNIFHAEMQGRLGIRIIRYDGRQQPLPYAGQPLAGIVETAHGAVGIAALVAEECPSGPAPPGIVNGQLRQDRRHQCQLKVFLTG
ncbi:hypothetical protein D3C76_1730960 [compost metagenome]